MSDEQAPAPDLTEAPGWVVLDPDGNVVSQGSISEAQAAGWLAELLNNSTEGEQQ